MAELGFPTDEELQLLEIRLVNFNAMMPPEHPQWGAQYLMMGNWIRAVMLVRDTQSVNPQIHASARQHVDLILAALGTMETVLGDWLSDAERTR